MKKPTLENLDLACAKMGNTIASNPSKELENHITKALGVLEEQGVYALFLFLKTTKDDEFKKIQKDIFNLLKRTPQQTPLLSGNTELFASLRQMAKDLDKLLLAHALLRRTLIYARYHARVPKKVEVSP